MLRERLSFEETVRKYPVGTEVSFRAGWSYKKRTELLRGIVVSVPSEPFGFPVIYVETDPEIHPHAVFSHQDFIFKHSVKENGSEPVSSVS